MSEPFELAARDGLPLGATLFRPRAPNGRALALLAATGVRQEFYAKFADYLSQRGFTVLTFDYRGTGRSRPARLRGFAARMRDWALLDAAAAFDHLERVVPDARLMAVGHSFGGQSLGLLPGAARLSAALMVGSQSGYWRNWPPLGRAWMWPVVHLILPVLPRLLGYFPSARLGFGEDLPAGVAIEWARWCRNPQYLVGALGVQQAYARFAAPIRAYSIADDGFAPANAVESLLALYPAAPTELRRVTPRELGAEAIGHFGFFRERVRESLWREAADWLSAQG